MSENNYYVDELNKGERYPVKDTILAREWIDRIKALGDDPNALGVFHLASFNGDGFKYCAVGHLCEAAKDEGLMHFFTFAPRGTINRWCGYTTDDHMVLSDAEQEYNRRPINLTNGLLTEAQADILGFPDELLGIAALYNDTRATDPQDMAKFLEDRIAWEEKAS